MSGRFAKIDSGIHRDPKIRRAGRAAREVFVWALCLNGDKNGNGRVPAGHLAPDYLSELLMMPEDEAAEGLERCMRPGPRGEEPLLRRDGDQIVIVGWSSEEWGSGKSTERVRRFRERNAAKRSSGGEKPDETVPPLRSVPATEEKRGNAETHTRGEDTRVEENICGALPARRAPTKRRAPSGDHQVFIARFDELFSAKNLGSRPSWGGKEGRLVAELLKRPGGLAEALKRAENMFAAPPPFPPPPHDLATFAQHFDKFAQPHRPSAAIGQYKHTGDEEYAGGEVDL